MPFVVARIDRTGADVDVFSAIDAPPADRAHVKGRTKHIHKFGGGGWAHLRFQHNTEEAWRKNAEEVAAAVDEKAQEHGVRLLVLGGDQRARTFVVEALPAGRGYDVVEVEGNVRAEGASEDQLDSAVETAVAARLTGAERRTCSTGCAPLGSRCTTAPRSARPPWTSSGPWPPSSRGRSRCCSSIRPVCAPAPLVVGPGPHDIALPGGPAPGTGRR